MKRETYGTQWPININEAGVEANYPRSEAAGSCSRLIGAFLGSAYCGGGWGCIKGTDFKIKKW